MGDIMVFCMEEYVEKFDFKVVEPVEVGDSVCLECIHCDVSGCLNDSVLMDQNEYMYYCCGLEDFYGVE